MPDEEEQRRTFSNQVKRKKREAKNDFVLWKGVIVGLASPSAFSYISTCSGTSVSLQATLDANSESVSVSLTVIIAESV